MNRPVINSFGIIAYCINNEKILFLLHQKRDTFAYVEFVRGLWNYETQIPSLFSHMTREERSRLTRYTFRELWDDLWVDRTAYMFAEGYPKALKKFELVSKDIPHYIESVQTQLEEPHWAFPKGRREGNEFPLVCAKREFQEETRLSSDKLFVYQFDTFFERFSGMNGKLFSTTYFLGKYPEPEIPERMPLIGSLRTSTISSEAYDLRWMEYDEAINHLEEFRKPILYEAFQRVKYIERI